MFENAAICVIIPALNEEQAIARVLAALPRWVNEVVVVDNGSTNQTADIAARCGAKVVHEPQRGYGSACLAGIAAVDHPDIVVFLDGDGSDDPRCMDRMVAPIARNEVDLVIGSRARGVRERGSLTIPQRVGNALACFLLRFFWGVRYTDLGPFRAIRADALRRLAMDDLTYGWTMQMQIRAAKRGLRTVEIPVDYRRRIGRSKISGTLRGAIGAGIKILSTVLQERFHDRQGAAPSKLREKLIVFTRYPQSGRVKTRLMSALGPDGAAELQRRMKRLAKPHAQLAERRSLTHRLPGRVCTQTGGSFFDGRPCFFRASDEPDTRKTRSSCAAPRPICVRRTGGPRMGCPKMKNAHDRRHGASCWHVKTE